MPVRCGGFRLLSDRFGRKRLLLFSAVLFTATSIGTGMANHFAVFLAWRICWRRGDRPGLQLVADVYRRGRPAGMRGRLVAVNQLTIVIGILLRPVYQSL